MNDPRKPNLNMAAAWVKDQAHQYSQDDAIGRALGGLLDMLAGAPTLDHIPWVLEGWLAAEMSNDRLAHPPEEYTGSNPCAEVDLSNDLMPDTWNGQPTGRMLHGSVGKTFGCYQCEKEFADADELKNHEQRTGHGTPT